MDTPTESEEDDLESLLRLHIVRHNWQALGFAVLTLVGAVFLWMVLYGVLNWLVMLFVVVVKDPDGSVPRGFRLTFCAIAGALLVAAWMDRLATVNERPPDKRPAFEVFMDFLLAVPRATLAVWGNFSAMQWLHDADYHGAADLLEAVARQRQLPMQSTPLYIQDARQRDRVVYALLLSRVLEVRLSDGESSLHLSSFRPPELAHLDQLWLKQ